MMTAAERKNAWFDRVARSPGHFVDIAKQDQPVDPDTNLTSPLSEFPSLTFLSMGMAAIGVARVSRECVKEGRRLKDSKMDMYVYGQALPTEIASATCNMISCLSSVSFVALGRTLLELECMAYDRYGGTY